MAGKEGGSGSEDGGPVGLFAALNAEIERALAALQAADLSQGDAVAAERHARAAGTIALAAKRIAALREARPEPGGEDMDDIQGDDDPVELERLHAALLRRIDGLRTKIERKRAEGGWTVVGRGDTAGAGDDAGPS